MDRWTCKAASRPGDSAKASRSLRMLFDWRRAELNNEEAFGSACVSTRCRGLVGIHAYHLCDQFSKSCERRGYAAYATTIICDNLQGVHIAAKAECFVVGWSEESLKSAAAPDVIGDPVRAMNG